MISRPIKLKQEYLELLEESDQFFENPPEKGTKNGDRFELIILLLSDYESRTVKIGPPDPIEAIRFRMDQGGLKQRDLIPFVGSRNKVSEVLNRRRPLTLKMIRALHYGLEIPADSLLQQSDYYPVGNDDLNWNKFPLREMRNKGWIDADDDSIEMNPGVVARNFIQPVRFAATMVPQFKRTVSIRTARAMNPEALVAWTARVIKRALEINVSETSRVEVDPESMRNLAQLSSSDFGPILAIDFLRARGIALIIESHLSGTYLDGATIFYDRSRPIIGMTLRFDRLDNFWFTLLHEVAHVALHAGETIEGFFDDLEFHHHDDQREREADELAREVLIPQRKWGDSPARTWPSSEAVTLLADELSIHPAIVAGRIRFEKGSYKILSNLVGYHDVRKHFPDVEWKK